MNSQLKDAKHGAEIKAVDAYCWLHSTTNLDTGLMRKLNTLPKIRNPCQGYPMADHDIDTLYYQWVPFFLFFQVIVVFDCLERGHQSS